MRHFDMKQSMETAKSAFIGAAIAVSIAIGFVVVAFVETQKQQRIVEKDAAEWKDEASFLSDSILRVRQENKAMKKALRKAQKGGSR